MKQLFFGGGVVNATMLKEQTNACRGLTVRSLGGLGGRGYNNKTTTWKTVKRKRLRAKGFPERFAPPAFAS